MLYTIVRSFGPEDGKRWLGYLEWRGVRLERFDSIDGITRPSLFRLESPEDWRHVVQEDNMTHYLADLAYAKDKQRELKNSELVGISFDSHDEDDPGFRGYDLIDGDCSVSLLTNWGNDEALINASLEPNALVRHFAAVKHLHEHLLATYPEDGHVEGCRIVSILRCGLRGSMSDVKPVAAKLWLGRFGRLATPQGA